MALERPTLPSGLLAQIRRRQSLERALRGALPKELASHVFLLNVRGDTLVLGSDVQALITPLRFQAPQLLATAREVLNEGAPVRVAWRTIPPPPQRHEVRHPQRPSDETANVIESAAGSVDDPQLSQALHRLAQAMNQGKK